ncbi:hypothetical protein HKD37_18G051799 [Glycine soja]
MLTPYGWSILTKQRDPGLSEMIEEISFSLPEKQGVSRVSVMASNQEVTVPCRYWVDNERKRVVMAEASGHFVDVLFSFLTLPLGTIIRLGNTLGQPIEIGCINNLFKSVEALNPDVFWNDICKRMLL